MASGEAFLCSFFCTQASKESMSAKRIGTVVAYAL